ncbi:hypothetical protein BS47DRAFT_1360544 [Hydnum rufescens UP504]|uniref:Uncharacterized protein n=1 Tax=Hydnum rufescens UP504 TaxID=1448309 RepID=A0A9P6B293_9AGAM|nr:hypothetical protein BS47DRAFT_1360544 [Hydnum rufescens UP504]
MPLRLVQGGKQLGTTPSGGIPKPPGPARRLPGLPIPPAGLPLPHLQPLCARIPPPSINIIQESTQLQDLGGQPSLLLTPTDKVVEPTLSPPSTSSAVYSIRKWRPSQPRSSPLSFSAPSQDTVTYHPTTHECTFIPSHLCSPHQFQEIVRHLDQCRDEYSPLSSGPPLTTYQFLVTWASPILRECPSSYFLSDEDLGGWYMDRRWMVAVQLALEKLQAVIRDTLSLVSTDGPGFLIDLYLELSEKLWRARDLRELRTADKLLKLRVQLAFAHLEKLERLHKGLSWASP